MAPSTVRSHFADTAFWTPAVVTDGDGARDGHVHLAGQPDHVAGDHPRLDRRRAGRQRDGGGGDAKGPARPPAGPALLRRAGHGDADGERAQLPAQAETVRLRLQLEGDSWSWSRRRRSAAGRRPAESRIGGSAARSWSAAARPRPSEIGSRCPRTVRRGSTGRFACAARATVKIRMVAQTDEEFGRGRAVVPGHRPRRREADGEQRCAADRGRPSSGDNGGGHGTTQHGSPSTCRRRGSPARTELNLQLTPSVAGTMLDALPYLADYPYGCIEQTMSRFLPSVVVAKTLQDLGLRTEELEKRANAYSAELQARRAGSQPVAQQPLHLPAGHARAQSTWPSRHGSSGTGWIGRRSSTRRCYGRWSPPGWQRIVAAQNGDGGWGWWPGTTSDPYMSAYVLYGLITARDAGLVRSRGGASRALEFVKRSFLEDDDLHRMAYAAAVLWRWIPALASGHPAAARGPPVRATRAA